VIKLHGGMFFGGSPRLGAEGTSLVARMECLVWSVVKGTKTFGLTLFEMAPIPASLVEQEGSTLLHKVGLDPSCGDWGGMTGRAESRLFRGNKEVGDVDRGRRDLDDWVKSGRDEHLADVPVVFRTCPGIPDTREQGESEWSRLQGLDSATTTNLLVKIEHGNDLPDVEKMGEAVMRVLHDVVGRGDPGETGVIDAV
jgi:hypothetical protein